ncbi:hypothetical protein ACWGHM_42875 [Streptomyces sp. NPDC054904]
MKDRFRLLEDFRGAAARVRLLGAGLPPAALAWVLSRRGRAVA